MHPQTAYCHQPITEQTFKAQHPPSIKPNSWSQDSLQCYLTSGNCAKCPTYQQFGLSNQGQGQKKCHIPKTVGFLLRNHIAIPPQALNKISFTSTVFIKETPHANQI
jgi:hypothetical protein